jgi:protein-S-isoprenylcysteine O-methyltransferase Ste14
MSPSDLFLVCWRAWGLSWIAAARWSSAPVLRPAAWVGQLAHGLMALGIVLVVPRTSAWLHAPRLWSIGRSGAYALALLTIPGFLFAWWARFHLGRLWSGAVTLKPGHSVVDTGPYALVRHPIYTGLLEAAFASAVATGSIAALAGFGLVTLGIWLKARLEERLLSRELRAGLYGAYRRRVPMFVPGWRIGGGQAT